VKQATDRIEATEPSGGNAIAKVCAIFRGLTANRPLRLSEVADIAGLNRVTALRILDSLANEGFVERQGSPPRYILGPEIAAMTKVATPSTELVGIVRPSLIRLAAETEDTALLSVRINNESVCLDRQTGTYPIRANFLEVGSRRPLGAGGGAMALLAWMPDLEIEAVLDANASRIAAYPRLSLDVLRSYIRDARTRGYVLMVDVVVEKMGAIGAPIFDSSRSVVGALSVPALTERTLGREKEIAAAMLREVARIERQLLDREGPRHNVKRNVRSGTSQRKE